MMRRLLLLLFALAGCKESSTGTTATTDAAAPPPSLAASAAPPEPTGFPTAPVITLQVQKAVPIEFLARGTWVAFSPKGQRAIVGAPGRASMYPGDKPIPGREVANAAFSSDGKYLFLVHSGENVLTNEVAVVGGEDMHPILKLQNAFDPMWSGDDLVFDRGGQVWRATVTRPAAQVESLVGPPKPAFKDRPKLVAIAPALDAMIVVDHEGPRPTGIRRVALNTTTHDSLLIGTDVLSKFGKLVEPLAIASPDAKRACILGMVRSECAVWCAAPDEPAVLVASFVDQTRASFAAGFLGPTKIWFRTPAHGAVTIADLDARTIASLPIPANTTATDLLPLPGGKLAVARDFYRLGILELDARTYTPIGDPYASPKAVAGLAPDATVFAVLGSSLDGGQGVFRVKTP